MRSETSEESLRRIQEILLDSPEARAWPIVEELVRRELRPNAKPCWEYAFHAAEACGAESGVALRAAAAIFCLLHSIHLVDDLLDEDPEGLQHRVGSGTAANLALAFQGLAAFALEGVDWPAEARALAQASLGRCALATAFGQNLDAEDPEGEEAYWRVVHHKTPPLFGCALLLGSLAGGADPRQAAVVEKLGLHLGEIVQINDDLRDAMERPAAPDWRRRWTNLPILYARLAEHAEKERFEALRERVFDDSDALLEAQDILVRSGAVSYCAYRLLEAYRAGRRHVAGLGLERPEALDDLLAIHVRPLRALFERIGVESPDELFAP